LLILCSAHAGCIIIVCAHIKLKITKLKGPLLLSALRSYGGGVLHNKYNRKLRTVPYHWNVANYTCSYEIAIPNLTFIYGYKWGVVCDLNVVLV
jgi:hypothetical protein